MIFNRQMNPTAMKHLILCVTVVFLCNACSVTKNWQGASDTQATQADFKELNGRQVFTLQVPDNDVYLIYQFKKTSGTLEASIKSPSNVVFDRQVDAVESNSIHILNQKGVAYRILVKGRDAAGNFNVRFRSASW